MTLVVMAASFRLPRTHRQNGLTPVERLDLALLVNTEHQCPFGRRHVEPDDVSYFFYKQRIRRELEAFDAVGLQAEGLPNSMNRRGCMAHRLSASRLSGSGALPPRALPG